ncbi:MAG: hypothetical protein ACRDKH_01530 [Solirubrobacterales bacterium]
MDPDGARGRIEAGPVLAAIGAVILLVSLFLGWYEEVGTAWEVFEVWDLVLAGLALVALYSAFEEVSGREPLAERLLPLVGIAALVIVISQVINDPPAATGAGNDTGIWLALAGSALMALGGVLASTHVSVALVTNPREREGTRATEPLDRER